MFPMKSALTEIQKKLESLITKINSLPAGKDIGSDGKVVAESNNPNPSHFELLSRKNVSTELANLNQALLNLFSSDDETQIKKTLLSFIGSLTQLIAKTDSRVFKSRVFPGLVENVIYSELVKFKEEVGVIKDVALKNETENKANEEQARKAAEEKKREEDEKARKAEEDRKREEKEAKKREKEDAKKIKDEEKAKRKREERQRQEEERKLQENRLRMLEENVGLTAAENVRLKREGDEAARELAAAFAVLNRPVATAFLRALEGNPASGETALVSRNPQNSMVNSLLAQLRELIVKESDGIQYIQNYMPPEGFNRGQDVAQYWGPKLKPNKDFRTYDLVKLHAVLSTRRYIAVTHLLAYMDKFDSTLTTNGISNSDSSSFKEFAMAFIFHIIVNPKMHWDDLIKSLMDEFITVAKAKNSKCNVLEETLATIANLTAVDETLDVNLQTIAASLSILFQPKIDLSRTSGLLSRLIPTKQEFYSNKILELATGSVAAIKPEEYLKTAEIISPPSSPSL